MILLFGLLAFLAPMEQKSKKAKPYDHETNDSAIWLICLFGSHVRRSKKQKKIQLFGFGSGEKAKAKKPNSAFWLIGGIPIGSKIGFGGVQKQKNQKASVPNLAFWWDTKLIGGVPIGF